MLIIRQEQMRCFEQAARTAVQTRLCEFIGVLLRASGADFDSEEIARLAGREIEFARGFGFTIELEVARYAGIMCARPGAGRDPIPQAALSILHDRQLSPSERLDRLAASFQTAAGAAD